MIFCLDPCLEQNFWVQTQHLFPLKTPAHSLSYQVSSLRIFLLRAQAQNNHRLEGQEVIVCFTCRMLDALNLGGGGEKLVV